MNVHSKGNKHGKVLKHDYAHTCLHRNGFSFSRLPFSLFKITCVIVSCIYAMLSSNCSP